MRDGDGRSGTWVARVLVSGLVYMVMCISVLSPFSVLFPWLI